MYDYKNCAFHLLKQLQGVNKYFKCWWSALSKQNTVTKQLMNIYINPVLPEDPSYSVPTQDIQQDLSSRSRWCMNKQNRSEWHKSESAKCFQTSNPFRDVTLAR